MNKILCYLIISKNCCSKIRVTKMATDSLNGKRSIKNIDFSLRLLCVFFTPPNYLPQLQQQKKET